MRVASAPGENMFVHGGLSDLTEYSENLLKNRIEAIKLIHVMKQAMQKHIVSICGPANSGKTTLISQLLMNPEIQQLSGYELQQRTTGVIVRELCPDTFIIDSPGLDAAQYELMKKFELSSALLGTAYVYIRLWQGPEQRDDMETVLKILELSGQESPHVLIVLNKVIANREDALGRPLERAALLGICDRFKSELRELHRQRNCVDELREDDNLWEWCRSKLQEMVERRCKNVTVVLGDLRYSRADITSKAPDIHDLIYDAAKIAEWCAMVVNPAGTHTSLHEHVRSVDYSQWAERCLDLENRAARANQIRTSS